MELPGGEDPQLAVGQAMPGDGCVAPTVQNVVATVDLGCRLDLKAIALRARNAEYNPRRFPAAILRFRNPNTTALLYASGRVVVTGAKTVDAARHAARRLARVVQKLGFPSVQFLGFTVHNVVGVADAGFPLRLERLAYDPRHGRFARYDPEFFPGLLYRMARPKATLLVFASGKVVVVGAKAEAEVAEAFANIYPVLLGYRKVEVTPAAEGVEMGARLQWGEDGVPMCFPAAASSSISHRIHMQEDEMEEQPHGLN